MDFFNMLLVAWTVSGVVMGVVLATAPTTRFDETARERTPAPRLAFAVVAAVAVGFLTGGFARVASASPVTPIVAAPVTASVSLAPVTVMGHLGPTLARR